MQLKYFICKEKHVLLCVDNSVDFLAVFNKDKKAWEFSKYKFADYQKYTLISYDEEVVLEVTKGVSPNRLYGEHLNYLVDCDIF